MRHTARLVLLAALLAVGGAIAVPWAWERAFPTGDGSQAERPADALSSATIDSVNTQLADVLSALGATPDAITDSRQEERESDGRAWTFSQTTVQLPRETPRDELELAFAVWPPGVEAFLTRADELTWSVRVYADKYPIHQLVLRQPLDPDPTVDPATPPRLAVVITGVGVRSADVEQLIDLPLPLTFAVQPYHSHSLRYATDAARGAKEVAVHLVFDEPSQPDALVGMTVPPPLSIRQGIAEFGTRLQEDIDAIPYASGALLSSGTATLADYESMESLVGALRLRDLYLLDAQPVDRGVALQVAHRSSLPATSATVADDAGPDSLLRLRNLAVLRGEAIFVVPAAEGCGDRIESFLAERIEEGYRLVFTSELVSEHAASN